MAKKATWYNAGGSGAGDERHVLARVAFSIWVVRIPLAYLFVVVLRFGAASVWWSMNISRFIQAILLYRWYARRNGSTQTGPDRKACRKWQGPQENLIIGT